MKITVVAGMVLPLMLAATAAQALDGNYIDAPAQLVVADPTLLTPGEDAVVTELQVLHYLVSVIDDGATATATTATSVVLLSPSADPAVLGSKYRDSAAPVIALGYGQWNQMGLTAGYGYSQTTTQNLLVVDATHPIAAGLPQTFAPATTSTDLQAIPEQYLPASADPVAVRSGVTSAHVVYTMDAGAIRADSTSTPAHRVALGLTEQTLADLSSDGLVLLDNSIYWADGSPTGTDASAPSVLAAGTQRVVGKWLLDQLNSMTGVKITPSALDPAFNGQLDSMSSVRRVVVPAATTGPAALYFRGWDDTDPASAPAGDVDATESSVRIPNNPNGNFNPGNSYFKISVNVRPRDPSGVAGIANFDTLNIVQKGTSAMGGKQWKVQMRADNMRPECVFVGTGSPMGTSNTITIQPPLGPTGAAASMAAFNTPPTPSAPNQPPRGGYNITCELRSGQANLTLTEISLNQTTGKVQMTPKYTSGFIGPAVSGGGTAGMNPAFTVTNTD